MRYAHDPVAYESEEWSRPDEMALFGLLWRHTRRELDRRPNSRVLDLCCGSGMSLLGAVSHPHLRLAVGVDVSPALLEFARYRYSPFARVAFVCADAVHAPFTPGSFDLLVLSSAYHHIEPTRKAAFLDGCRELLATGGRLLMAENVLPPYEDEGGAYDRSVRALYAAVAAAALEASPDLPAATREMIDENVRLSLRREYEFKVDRPRLERDLRDAGFVIEQEVKAWPHDDGALEASAGNVLFVLRTRERGNPSKDTDNE